jgi:ATP-binding cassette subfamily B protein
VSAKAAKRAPERLDQRRLLRLYRAFAPLYRPHTRALAWSFTGLGLSTITTLLLPWPLKMVLDHVVLHRALPAQLGWLSRWADGDPLTLLLVLSAGYLGLRLLDSLFTYVHRVGLMVVAQKLATEIRERLFAKLQRLSLSFHGGTRAGDLVLRLLSDVSDIKIVLIEVPQTAALQAGLLVTHATLMFLLDWRLALIAFAAVPPMVLYNRRVGATSRPRPRSGAARRARSRPRLRERDRDGARPGVWPRGPAAPALPEREPRQPRLGAQGDEALQVVQARERPAGRHRHRRGAVAGGRLALRHELSPGTIVLFVAYLRNLYNPIDKISQTILDAAGATASGERCSKCSSPRSVLPEGEGAVEAPAARGPGRVRRRDVRLPERRARAARRALRGRAGRDHRRDRPQRRRQVDAAVAAAALLRSAGRAHPLDGRDLRELKIDSMRRQIAVVMQESRLFQKSVRENIRFGKLGATDARSSVRRGSRRRTSSSSPCPRATTR